MTPFSNLFMKRPSYKYSENANFHQWSWFRNIYAITPRTIAPIRAKVKFLLKIPGSASWSDHTIV